ncbi:Ribosomal protein S18 acetylase RimI [Asanoa hainanensis]|uniref:Ribosomal protein S18 acetylase RimI n=1 Tax=Asanoa hainanensis TaxID=560556 RepID=A0A239JN08_9ACTN|nr:GNAT family N-acetyltransferase [Asanoa hainanensis]SNT07149.1 Ribosomal protein S18 acetylase RimI [Asanoa hainanensis]
MTELNITALRDAYDSQLRTYDPELPGVTVEFDGPLKRASGMMGGGYLVYQDLGGLAGAELDELIARQRDHFRDRGQQVEWKLHGHDEPADLAERLTAHGFVAEEQETIVIGPVAPLAAALPVLPPGVRLRDVSQPADLDRIVRMEETVWGDDRSWIADMLGEELAAHPSDLVVTVAEDVESGEVVSAGWVRFVPGTAFATLWGGSTLPAYRRRGIYRALVAHRARLAEANGFTLLQVDASDDSRPILERLGFVAVTTTTPYVYHP